MARRKRKRMWIQRALKKHKRGALHRMMGIRLGETIPLSALHGWNRISKWVGSSKRKSFHGHSAAWWRLVGRRTRFAINVRKRK